MTPQELYFNIEEIAWSRGMNARTACIKADISPNVLSKLKTGVGKDIQLTTAYRLAQALRCSMDDFCRSGKIPEQDKNRKPSRGMADFKTEDFMQQLETRQELRRLIRAAMKASPKQVNSLAALLESVNNVNDKENQGNEKTNPEPDQKKNTD